MTSPLTTLPDLKTPYPLTDAQVQAFRQDGHILLQEVASQDEAAAYLPVIRQAVQQHNTETRLLAERETRRQAFLQIMNLWTKDEGVRRFTLATRFAHLAAALLVWTGCAFTMTRHSTRNRVAATRPGIRINITGLSIQTRLSPCGCR